MHRTYPKFGCLGCGQIFPARRFSCRKARDHMSICCPEKLQLERVDEKMNLNSRECEVPGDAAAKERERVANMKQENRRKCKERKKEGYRYDIDDYGGWGYGGRYRCTGRYSLHWSSKIHYYYEDDEARYHKDIIFYRPDGDTEGKSIDWCESNGFFQVAHQPEVVWSGPWYYDHFPEERKERKCPHACPTNGCRERFETDEGLDKHVRMCQGKAHDIYRREHNIVGGPTQEEIDEEERNHKEAMERFEREKREEERLFEEMVERLKRQHMQDITSRVCIQCGKRQEKDNFSGAQWKKKENYGEPASRCKTCVGEPTVPWWAQHS